MSSTSTSSTSTSSTSNMKNSLETTLKTFITDYSEHLSQWLGSNKNVEVSAEEICAAFDCPCPSSSSLSARRQSGVGVSAGVGGPSGSGSVGTQMPNYFSDQSPAGRKSTTTRKRNTDPNAPKCSYVISRGAKSGQTCPKTVAGTSERGGDKYCKDCLKKTSVASELSGETTSVVQPSVLPGSEVSVTESSVKSSNISAVPLENEDGMYRELNHNFIFQQSDSSYVVLSVQDDDTRRPLTVEEEKIAKDLGFEVQKQTRVASTAQPTVTMPAAKKSFNIPNIKH